MDTKLPLIHATTLACWKQPVKIVVIIREISIAILIILVLIVNSYKKIVAVIIILTQGNKILGPGGAMEGTDYAMLRAP